EPHIFDAGGLHTVRNHASVVLVPVQDANVAMLTALSASESFRYQPFDSQRNLFLEPGRAFVVLDDALVVVSGSKFAALGQRRSGRHNDGLATAVVQSKAYILHIISLGKFAH